MVVNGCKFNQTLTLFTQYIPIKRSLNDFIANISNKTHKLYELTAILHMVYQLLSSFANIFTHYDLHMDNVVLLEVPTDKFIHVVYHYPDGTILRYNMCYIPIIIDYGRCFINCKQMDGSKANSKEIMKTVCSKDSQRIPSNSMCNETCGNYTGYQFSTNYDVKTDTFEPSTISEYFIDYTRHNISHDLRLLNEIRSNLDFSNLAQGSFIVKKLVRKVFNRLAEMDNRFGTHEETRKSHLLNRLFRKEPSIDNVIMAASKLTDIISDPQFNINNDSILNTKTLYGTLQIWTDLSRPFEFQ